MMTENETLLKTLVSDTRRQIIKELSNGYRTPSDLSKILAKNKSTIVEHLEKLVETGLVRKAERPGRKWVFYSLTDKGEDLVSQKSHKIIIILSMMLLSFLAGVASLYSYITRYNVVPSLQEAMIGKAAENITGGAAVSEAAIIIRNQAFLYFALALFAISAICAVSIILLKRRRIEVWP